MSSSEAKAHISLSGEYPGTELRLIDSKFRVVAHGVGELVTDVAKGIYRIETQLGTQLRSELISVGAGDTYEDSPYIAFASAAPVEGTSTTHEYHQEAARSASRERADLAGGGDAALVVVLRALTELGDRPVTPHVLEALDLLDSDLGAVAQFDSLWKLDEASATATSSANLPHGGYVLSYERSFDVSEGGAAFLCRPVWLSLGWQTLLFLRSTPLGLSFDAMSAHMSELGSAWEPWGDAEDPRSENNTTMAVELALEGMSIGRRLIPNSQLGILLDGKFVNPMLGILGAHSMLLDPPGAIDKPLLEIVITNLAQLAPGHPDVTALEIMSEPLIGFRPTPDVTVTFPPMLLKSFETLLRYDATHPGTISGGTSAEVAASNLVVQGLWTTWHPRNGVPTTEVWEEAEVAEDFKAFNGDPEAEGATSLIGRGVIEPIKPTHAARSRAFAKRGGGISSDELRGLFADPATARVANYVAAVADVREVPLEQAIGAIEEAHLSLGTSLPRSTVRKVLPRVRKAVEGE